MRVAAGLAIVATAVGGVLGCSDDDGRRLPAQLEKGVYAHEDYGLLDKICVAHQPGAFGPDAEARSRRQGQRMLAALIRAYHLAPNAPLTVGYITSDDGELERETTVRRWAQHELAALREYATGKRATRCDREAFAELKRGLRLRGPAFKRWSARETVRSYVVALAHGDERAACRRISPRAVRADLDRLAEVYRVPTISRQDTSDRAACLRISERIAEAMTSVERKRFAGQPIGAARLTARAACVGAARSGFPLTRGKYGTYTVHGLRPLAPPERARQQTGRFGYHGC